MKTSNQDNNHRIIMYPYGLEIEDCMELAYDRQEWKGFIKWLCDTFYVTVTSLTSGVSILTSLCLTDGIKGGGNSRNLFQRLF